MKKTKAKQKKLCSTSFLPLVFLDEMHMFFKRTSKFVSSYLYNPPPHPT